jgi:hypothetical protein
MVTSPSENKAIIGTWFNSLWGHPGNLDAIEQLGAPELLLQYSTLGVHRRRQAVKDFLSSFRRAFPDLDFRIVGELAAEREFVLVHWQGQGTHLGPAFNDFSIGPWPMASGNVFRLAGHSAIKLVGGKVVEEAIWSAQRLEQARKSSASLAL